MADLTPDPDPDALTSVHVRLTHRQIAQLDEYTRTYALANRSDAHRVAVTLGMHVLGRVHNEINGDPAVTGAIRRAINRARLISDLDRALGPERDEAA